MDGFLPILDLDPTRPFTSEQNLIAFFLTAITCVVLIWQLSRRLFAGRPRATPIYLSCLAVFVLISVPLFERYTSCELFYTHKNIQAIFESAAAFPGTQDAIVDRGNGRVVISSVVAKDNSASAFELEGHAGEPTCSAYVIRFSDAYTLQKEHTYPKWFKLPMSPDNTQQPDVTSILRSVPYISDHIGSLYFSIQPFRLPKGKSSQEVPYNYVSLIGCMPWPYGWVYEL